MNLSTGQVGTPVLSCSDLSKHYGGVMALERASLEIRAGEVVALVGDNGAGKSTLVGCLTGAIRPESGHVFLAGQDLTDSSPSMIREMGVETVYQSLALPPDLSCVAGMFLGRELRRSGVLGKLGFLNWAAMREQAIDNLQKLGATVRNAQNPISSLSGGQRQAVAITRAVMWGSRVLILDEPTAALGVVQTARVLSIVEACRESGIGVLMVSHNLNDVLAVADRIVVLRLGRVVATLQGRDTDADQLVSFITGLRSE